MNLITLNCLVISDFTHSNSISYSCSIFTDLITHSFILFLFYFILFYFILFYFIYLQYTTLYYYTLCSVGSVGEEGGCMVPVLAAAAHLYSLPYAPPLGLPNHKTGSRID
jgi:hypothetical protein